MTTKPLLAGLLALLAAATSCNKTFLDETPQSFVSGSTYFKTQADFTQAVNGAYAGLRTLYGTPFTSDANPGYGAWQMGEMRSDNTTFIYRSAQRGYVDRENVATFLDDATTGAAGLKYDADYVIIARANDVISRIDAATFDAATKDNLKGQALFLRALAYFDLVRYFGDVPLALTPATTLAETSLPRSPRADVYAQIVADAKAAAPLLPLKAAQEAGRATRGSAQMLLGDVYLTLKQYADAETVLRQLVSSSAYSLVADYANVFSTTNKNNSESIFEVQYLQGATTGLQSNFIYTFLPVLTDPGVVTGLSGPSNTWGGFNIPTPDLLASYEANDARKAASVGTVDGYPYIKKYQHPHAIWNNTDDNWPVYRYSEALLALAEVLNEQNKSADALPFLNQVRSRAGLGAASAAGQAAVRTAIAHERQVELAFENKRWLDLVRTGQAVAVMSAFGARVKANPTAYYYPAGVAPVPTSYVVTDNRLLFPIPLREIQLNPQLTQNPGY